VGHSRLQQEAYSKITAVSMIIENPAEAPELIDSIINDCLLYKAPVFIELPADIVMAECDAPAKWKPDMTLPVDKGAMNEAVRRTVGLLQKARKPAILAGGAFSRLNMEDEFADFLEYTGYPASSIVNSKGMIPENLPNFVGTYCGKLLSGKARRIIEDADVLIVLGVLFSELNVGLFTAKLNEARMVYAQPMSVSIGRDNYEYVHIEQFVRRLKQELKQGECRLPWKDHPSHVLDKAYNPRRNAKLTSKRFWMRLNRFLEKGHFLITDSGSAILESAAMYLPDGVKMLAQDFYLSIGYSLPAAMGVKFARPGIRPVVVIGDGAFQMTCQELSTMIRNKLNPVVFVINNDGYQIERVIYDNTYNDIQPWKYHKLPEVFGGGLSFRVETEGELEDAVKTADENRGELIFIEVCVGRFDYPPTLERFGRLLR
jgi:indolepyruvate decarboxylase